MSNARTMNGQCLCGKVRVQAEVPEPSIGVCHCSTCRAWGGGPFMTIDCGTAITFSGDPCIGTFDSSEWAERGFCRDCGTHLFYRLKQTGQTIVAAGLINPDERMVFDHQVFIDEKPGYYAFANETKDMTGPEVFAMFGADSE